MNGKGWMGELEALLASLGDAAVIVDRKRLIPAANAYFVRSIDGMALQFSVPVLIPDAPVPPADLPPEGSDGAVLVLIEHIKDRVRHHPGLRAIGGLDTPLSGHHAASIEPVTFVHSPGAIGQMLWKADEGNGFAGDGLHLVVRGALPYPGPPDAPAIRGVAERVSSLLDGLDEAVRHAPLSRMEEAQLASADQKLLRARLPGMGLVCFIGDGSRIARMFTRHRPYFRVAGPKEGVHVPFICPDEASPIEVDLPCSNETVTGLGIGRGEVLAITGSNAEGKSTLLEGIIAGEDDHAPGDGREHLVTVRGAATAQTGAEEMRGEDISMFFSRLPPGVGGTPRRVFGRGSGSMVMAARIQQAIDRDCPLLLLDEDRSATNLLVPCSTQDREVTPLASLIDRNRSMLGGTAFVVAAATMDFLTAQADRILALEAHEVRCIDRGEFRRQLRRHLGWMAETLEDPAAERRGGSEKGMQSGGEPPGA
jgi:predicted ABC-class ATPase